MTPENEFAFPAVATRFQIYIGCHVVAAKAVPFAPKEPLPLKVE